MKNEKNLVLEYFIWASITVGNSLKKYVTDNYIIK